MVSLTGVFQESLILHFLVLWFSIPLLFGVSVRILLFPHFFVQGFLEVALGKSLIISGNNYPPFKICWENNQF